jgi:hypothetical protein
MGRLEMKPAKTPKKHQSEEEEDTSKNKKT